MKITRAVSFTVFLSFLLGDAAAQSVPPEPLHHVTPWETFSSSAQTVQSSAQPGQGQSIPLSLSQWTPLGPAPAVGTGSYSGRITGIAAHPTNANIIYIAAAGGGVWKTTDGGSSWIPLTDSQPTLAMGAIALAPSNPSVIYAGTGEANNSGDSHFGGGILVSKDGGVSWTLATGLPDRTSAIAVDPTNDKIAYAAMGSSNFLNTGLYKTTDGGLTWKNVTSTFLSSTYTYSDVKLDPNNPSIVYTAIGAYFGAGPNGVYKSVDGGANWLPLPAAPSGSAAGRIAIAISKSNSQVVYVVSHSSATGGLHKMMRSDDGGAAFTDLTTGTPAFLGTQGWYDIYLAVDPVDSSIIYAGGATANIGLIRSANSGVNWTGINIGVVAPFIAPHVDHHAVAFDANGLLLDGGDGGIFRLENPTIPLWRNLNGNLNTIQLQGIGLHPSDPDRALGGSQDNGTILYTGNLLWNITDGGDGGMVKFSPTLPSRAYHVAPVRSFGPSNFFRRSEDGGSRWTGKASGIVNAESFAFYPPFAVDPANGDRLLIGGDRVFESINAGDNWTAISAPGEGGWSTGGSVSALGLARSDTNTIYAAVGQRVYATTNHGVTWTSQAVAAAGLSISDIQVDPDVPATAYATINGFDPNGNVARTTDGGATWRYLPILGAGGALKPLSPLPVRSLQIAPGGTLFAGAEDGVYSLDRSVVASCNTGPSSPQCAWTRVGTGLPNVQVAQIEINANTGILAAGTYGRGMWQIALPKEPVLGITFTHGAAFVAGQQGASYRIAVKNSGTGTTTAPVTVTAVLAREFTAVSITGAGWTCVQPAGPCTRNDFLAQSSSFPVLTLTVNIAATVSPQVISRVTVTGGGSPEASANNAAVLCTYSVNPRGQGYPAAGGTATIQVSAPPGCPWSVANSLPWIAATGSTAGNGNGIVTLHVETNVGPARADTVTIAGHLVAFEQQAAFIPGLNLLGSMPHIAAQGNWSTTFTFVNTSPTPNQARFSMFDNQGARLLLPLLTPPAAGTIVAASLDRTFAGNASLVFTTAEPDNQTVKVGSAQLSADGAVNGFAIFSYLPTQQEAVVPLDSRGAGSYMLPFDHTNGVDLGVALANLSTREETINAVIRDDGGMGMGTGTIKLVGNGHSSFVLAHQFPVTANRRGVIEFSFAPGAKVNALGIRYTPPGTLTTIPVLASAATGTGYIPHLAVANGWKTTFVLVNTGNSPAMAHLKFFNDAGEPLALPLSFPQSGDSAVSSTVDNTVPAWSTLLVESSGPDASPLLTGSAQFIAEGSVTGFVIFRYLPNGQEAVVPLEDRTANAYVLAFDNTAGIVTGVAVSNASGQRLTIPVAIRNESGAVVGNSSITLPPNGHLSFLLGDRFPIAKNMRGTVEFGATGGKIGVVGIRTPPKLTFTTLPSIAK